MSALTPPALPALRVRAGSFVPPDNNLHGLPASPLNIMFFMVTGSRIALAPIKKHYVTLSPASTHPPFRSGGGHLPVIHQYPVLIALSSSTGGRGARWGGAPGPTDQPLPNVNRGTYGVSDRKLNRCQMLNNAGLFTPFRFAHGAI